MDKDEFFLDGLLRFCAIVSMQIESRNETVINFKSSCFFITLIFWLENRVYKVWSVVEHDAQRKSIAEVPELEFLSPGRGVDFFHAALIKLNRITKVEMLFYSGILAMQCCAQFVTRKSISINDSNTQAIAYGFHQ